MVLSYVGVAISKFSDFPTRMQDRGVISTTKRFANLRQRMIGEFLGEAHSHLPRSRDAPITPLGKNIGQLDVVVLGYRSLNVVDTNLAVLDSQ